MSDLSRGIDIPFEQNKTPRALGPDEFALGGAQFRSGYARDESPHVHQADVPPARPGVNKPGRNRPLIPLDDALAAGALQAAAELRGLLGGGERPHHGAVIDALFAEIGPFDDRLMRSEHA